jgi:tellurite resistance protein TerC
MGVLLFSLFRNNSQIETILFGVFATVIAVFLVIDLGVFNRKAHKISTKSALYQSIFWVIISSIFGYLVYYFDEGGFTSSIEFFSAYLTEYALSVDNIFVILLILKYFTVKEEYYHTILFWGILGAVVFRGVFIFVGALLIAEFHFILYIFGVFLIYSGIKIYFEDSDEKIDPEKNPILRLCRKYLPMTQDEMGGKFIGLVKGKWMFTPLFLVVALVETTDLIFAVDSIPAAFAITQNEFLIYTSNIFAVMASCNVLPPGGHHRQILPLAEGPLDHFVFHRIKNVAGNHSVRNQPDIVFHRDYCHVDFLNYTVCGSASEK